MTEMRDVFIFPDFDHDVDGHEEIISLLMSERDELKRKLRAIERALESKWGDRP